MRDKLLGTTSRRVRVTASERILIDKLDVASVQRTDVSVVKTMAPGTLPAPSKKKLRPSSAAAKLQSHPNYATGLYDNSRPSTAAPALQRPKTQAGGPRQWARTPQPKAEEAAVKPQRRLTVAAVDGIAEADVVQRTIAQPHLGALFKGKVSAHVHRGSVEAENNVALCSLKYGAECEWTEVDLFCILFAYCKRETQVVIACLCIARLLLWTSLIRAYWRG